MSVVEKYPFLNHNVSSERRHSVVEIQAAKIKRVRKGEKAGKFVPTLFRKIVETEKLEK